MKNWRLIFFIVFFVGVIATTSFFLYTLLIAPSIPTPEQPTVPTTPTETPTQPDITGGLSPSSGREPVLLPDQPDLIPDQPDVIQPGIDEPSIIQPLADISPQDFVLSFDGNVINYYDPEKGYLYKIEDDGAITQISSRLFPEAESVIWAPDSNKTVIEFPDGSNIVYDIAADEQVTLPPHWDSFDFSPQSNQLAFKSLGNDEDSRWLSITSTNGSKAKLIEHIGFEDEKVIVDWSPNNQLIAYYPEGVNGSQQEVFFIGQNAENFKSMMIDGYDLQGMYHPSGNIMAYSVYSVNTLYKPTLWIAPTDPSSIGSTRAPLFLETWASKCDFTASGDQLYCAVPRFLPDGAGIVPEIADDVPYDIYRIDVQSGAKRLIQLPENTSVDKIAVKDDESQLYYTDIQTGQLRILDL